MRILVIGGTSFVVRHFVQAALDRGHDVTLFNRGQTNPELFPAAEHLSRVRDLGTLELANGVGLLSLIVLLGVLPAILMDSVNFSVLTMLSRGGG